jgi:CRISPR-associated protein Cmr5
MTPRSHLIARHAYARVAARSGADFQSAYGALAHKLPMLILQNGLAQATGFLLAKERDEHHALLDDLAFVLHEARAVPSHDRTAFHEQIIRANLGESMRLTRNALDVSGWLKRYVQGVLRVDATGAADGERP